MSGNKENRRKCFKCGKSPASDNIKLFRFPKPATRNLLRCTMWAKYFFPSEEQYTSLELQKKLFSEHRMVCQNHFTDKDFTDSLKQRLSYSAFPCDAEQMSMVIPNYFNEPLPGPSQMSKEYGLTLQDPEASSSQAVERRALCNISNVELQCGERNIENVQTSSCSKKAPTLKTQNDKNHFKKCAKYMTSICQMRNRLKRMKRKVVLNALTDNNAVRKLARKLTPTFAFLLQAQIRNTNKSTGRRWTKEEKILALRLFKRSPSCYRLMRRLFQLPTPGTLKALLNGMPFAVGITNPVIKVLTNFIKHQQPSDNNFILMFDEMSLKKHLNYNKKEDYIEGYQDHGPQGRSPNVASYALVFMIAGIRKKVKQPIAHYFSSSFSNADRLAVLIKEILHQCFAAGIQISATVCDMDGVNRRALSILGATKEHPYLTMDDKEIVTLFDTPHLLKCFRNLFLKYDINCKVDISSQDKIGEGVAKWSHIEKFYELDLSNQNFVFAPALTKDHLNPNTKQKMRVKLAAQVLSHTVAAGLYAKISEGTLTPDAAVTANVVSKIDKLFDSLNSDTPDLHRGKLYATNMTAKSPHLQLFSEMKIFFSSMRFVGSARVPPSQDGWIWTVNGVERLFKNLTRYHNIKSLATRRLQQDPLENLFGCIRGNCGSNTNPTIGQFVAGLKTSVISNMAHIGTTGNCETDNNVIINNFTMLLSVSQPTAMHSDLEIQELIMEGSLSSSISQNIDREDNAEIQACAYVCGFLLKRIPTRNCEECKSVLVSPNISMCHMFVQCKEYSEYKNSLNYASQNFITCVESCASSTNLFLNENCYKKDLRTSLIVHLKTKINFDFLYSCPTHKDCNINFIVNSVFYICVNRFCKIKNRLFADEASASALKRKINIIMHK